MLHLSFMINMKKNMIHIMNTQILRYSYEYYNSQFCTDGSNAVYRKDYRAIIVHGFSMILVA